MENPMSINQNELYQVKDFPKYTLFNLYNITHTKHGEALTKYYDNFYYLNYNSDIIPVIDMGNPIINNPSCYAKLVCKSSIFSIAKFDKYWILTDEQKEMRPPGLYLGVFRFPTRYEMHFILNYINKDYFYCTRHNKWVPQETVPKITDNSKLVKYMELKQ